MYGHSHSLLECLPPPPAYNTSEVVPPIKFNAGMTVLHIDTV